MTITAEKIVELRDLWHFNDAELIEWAPFETLLTKHVASLADRLGFFVSRMSKSDREQVIEQSLWRAWERRAELDLRLGSLVGWWTSCVKDVIGRRDGWFWHYSTHRQWTSSKHLQAGIK